MQKAMNVSLLYCLLSILKYSRENVTSLSIKDALDMLPVGLCFANFNGSVALKNLKMDDYCREYTGEELKNIDEFLTEISLAGSPVGGQWITELGDRTVMFTEDDVEIDGEFYTELIASDVTEILDAYSDSHNDIDLEIMRWKLSVRASIHFEIGDTLRSSFFIKNPDERRPSELLRLLNSTSTILLKKSEPIAPRADDWLYVLSLCRAGGIGVEVFGEPPESISLREILARALRECAANTVKHSGGDRLYVRFKRDENSLTADFSNNGMPARKPVSESGGLKLVRTLVENNGGEMTVLHAPRFTVQIVIPLKGDLAI